MEKYIKYIVGIIGLFIVGILIKENTKKNKNYTVPKRKIIKRTYIKLPSREYY